MGEGQAGDGRGETPGETAAEAAEEPRADDGLELARSIARATAASAPGLRRRSGPRTGNGRAGRIAPRLSGARPDDRDPQTLAREVGRLVGERGWELSLRLRGVFARWGELVGAEIADHCTPEAFEEGRLTVRTDSTAWATQLRLLAPDVVRRLNDDLGPGTVVGLEVQGPHAPSWKRGPRSVRDGRGPRDTYG